MILVVGGLASGKKTFARSMGFRDDELALDVHELADGAQDVGALARRLASYEVVTCADVGSGVVPADAGQRAWREAVGTLSRLLAADASEVVRMVCGIPQTLKRERRRIGLVLIRHGQTPGNGERRYVGALDQPLSDAGRAQAREAGVHPEVARVYVSPLRRTHETAAIMFPNAEQVVVGGIQEMDFGAFAGRSADEMGDDAAYRAWVDGGCEGCCPHGESRAEFEERVCSSLARCLEEAYERGERRVTMVAHGGTMMASLSRFAADPRPYYEWLTGNCGAYHIDVELADPPVFTVKART